MTPDNFAITLYSCASVGYHDKEFFDNAIDQFTKEGKTPTLQNLGYMIQAMTLLRRNEYVPQLTQWLTQLI